MSLTDGYRTWGSISSRLWPAVPAGDAGGGFDPFFGTANWNYE